MDRHIEMTYLMDIYSSLLTERQQKVLEYYYSDDLAISEIARLLDISRQGVYDNLRRSEEVMKEYDRKLRLFDRYIRSEALLDEIIAKTDKNEIVDLAEEIKNNL